MAVLMQTRLCSSFQVKQLLKFYLVSFVVLSALKPATARPSLVERNNNTSPALADEPWRCVNATLDYYVQVLIGGLDIGVLIPAIEPSVTANFGYTEVFAFNVTEGVSATSKQLGYVRGYTVQASYDSTYRGVEVATVSYADGHTNGTIHIRGLIVGPTNEVAIVGGTGNFRGARGYGIVTEASATGDLVVYHHDLHFL